MIFVSGLTGKCAVVFFHPNSSLCWLDHHGFVYQLFSPGDTAVLLKTLFGYMYVHPLAGESGKAEISPTKAWAATSEIQNQASRKKMKELIWESGKQEPSEDHYGKEAHVIL